MASKAKELREKASRYAAVAPSLERIDEIDARLAAIDEDAGSKGEPLPKVEVAERLVSWLRARREEVEYPRRYKDGEPQPTPYVVTRLSGGHTDLSIETPREVFCLLAWIFGPDLERRALEAVDRAVYAEGASAVERERRRAALDAERGRLVDERERLVEEVRAGDVPVAHLPETQRRIEKEQAAERRRAEERERQKEAERQIEEREGAPRSAVIGRMVVAGEPVGG
jgi:hypothetical protein